MAIANGSQLIITVNSVPLDGENIDYNLNDTVSYDDGSGTIGAVIKHFLSTTRNGFREVEVGGGITIETFIDNLVDAFTSDFIDRGKPFVIESDIIDSTVTIIHPDSGYFDTFSSDATGLVFTIENEEITPETILQEAKETAQASGSLVEFKRYTYLLGAAYDREKTKNTQFLQLFNELNRTGVFTKEVDAEYTMLPNDKDIDVITANSGTNIILSDEVDFTGFQVLITNSTGANLTLNANAAIVIEDESGTQQSTYTLGSGIQVGLILKDNIYQLTVI